MLVCTVGCGVGRAEEWGAAWALVGRALDAGVVATVDGASDGTVLDELATVEEAAVDDGDADDEVVPGSISGMLGSTVWGAWPATRSLGGAEDMLTTSTAQPPTATAAAHVEINWPIRM